MYPTMEHLGTLSMAAERWASWEHSVRGKKIIKLSIFLFQIMKLLANWLNEIIIDAGDVFHTFISVFFI